MQGDTRPLGKRWLQKFIERNSSVASIIGRKIEPSRVEVISEEALQEFLYYLTKCEQKFNILTENILEGMDEEGITLVKQEM